MSSNKQIQRSVIDVIGLEEPEDADWSQGYLKRLTSATGTLYNTSLNKVMLKQDEETARCHICAFMACQKLAEKGMPDLQYHMDKIPLEPRRVRNLIGVFNQQLYQLSPVKSIQWSPSPRKSRRNSPLKNNDKFSAIDPKQLREELFGTPSKSKKNSIELSSSTKPSLAPTVNDEIPNSPTTPRRKLAFEEEDSDIEEESVASKSATAVPSNSIFGGDNKSTEETHVSFGKRSNEKLVGNDDNSEEEIQQEEKRTRKKHSGERKPYKTRDGSLLAKRYYKAVPQEVVDLCNNFELPKDVAFHILDEYLINSSYLICPWQLICGLVMNCVFIVFHERRRKDPRVDHLIMEKMVSLMNCSGAEEIVECIKIVKEIITGEKWYRDMQIDNNYFDGRNYDQVIAGKLGSMLQDNTILVTDEQFANWKERIEEDLALRQI